MLSEFHNVNPSDFSERQVEKLIIENQSIRMNHRAPGKYGPILFVVSLNPDLEVLYHFGRMVDDQIDGDTDLPMGFDNPYQLLDHLGEVATGSIPIEKSFSVDFLLKRSIDILQRRSGDNDNVEGVVKDFLNGMRLEYMTREKGIILSEIELAQLYKFAFEPAEDISMICLGTHMRSRNIPELAQAQGRSYSLNDLRVDIKNNIFRMPKEVIADSGLSNEELKNNPLLVDKSPKILAWIKRERMECVELKKRLLERDLDLKTRLLCNFLTFKI